jgi:hypothetical protein
MIQIFENDSPITEPEFIKISNRPTVPITSEEIYNHEITFSIWPKNGQIPNFNNKTIKIYLLDGFGNKLEEWALLKTKLAFEQDVDHGDYTEPDFLKDVTIFYENVIYKRCDNWKELLGIKNDCPSN